jgi:hypothetical protein
MDVREMLEAAYADVDREQARKLAQSRGLEEAIRLSKECRDMSSPGTMSFALHNRTVKFLEEMRDEKDK